MKKLLIIVLLVVGCGIFEKEEEEISINVEWLTVSQFDIYTGCSSNDTDDDGLALERLYTFYTNDSNFPSFQTEYDTLIPPIPLGEECPFDADELEDDNWFGFTNSSTSWRYIYCGWHSGCNTGEGLYGDEWTPLSTCSDCLDNSIPSWISHCSNTTKCESIQYFPETQKVVYNRKFYPPETLSIEPVTDSHYRNGYCNKRINYKESN